MWYNWELFRTRREALLYAANKMLADQPKRVEPLSRAEAEYREGFRWAVQVERRLEQEAPNA